MSAARRVRFQEPNEAVRLNCWNCSSSESQLKSTLVKTMTSLSSHRRIESAERLECRSPSRHLRLYGISLLVLTRLQSSRKLSHPFSKPTCQKKPVQPRRPKPRLTR